MVVRSHQLIILVTLFHEQEEYIQAVVDVAAGGEMGANFALPNVVAAVGDKSTFALKGQMQNISFEVDEGDPMLPPSTESQMAGVLSSEQYYLSESNDKKELLCICVGLGVGDWNSEPYASASGKQHFKPSRTDLQKEALCRYEVPGLTRKPSPSGWGITACLTYLNQNPITDPEDVTFIKAREQNFRALLVRTQEEAAEITNQVDGFYTDQTS
jgi:hypothetical protein